MSSPRVNFGLLMVNIVGWQAAFTLALFLPAGTMAWPTGWLFLTFSFVFSVLQKVWFIRHDPQLLAERMTGPWRPDRKGYDKIFVPIFLASLMAWLAVIALDAVRFHWSNVPVWLQVIGSVLLVTSYYGLHLTFRANSYCSSVVRIQNERGQKVISTGLYRHVRHPMYGAFVLYAFGAALMLGSWLGVFVGAVLIIAMARRSIWEERTLQQELPGYDEYMAKVRYRLIPGIW